jgi:hypothetical protein
MMRRIGATAFQNETRAIRRTRRYQHRDSEAGVLPDRNLPRRGLSVPDLPVSGLGFDIEPHQRLSRRRSFDILLAVDLHAKAHTPYIRSITNIGFDRCDPLPDFLDLAGQCR